MIFQSPDIFGGEGTLLIGKKPKVFYLKVKVEGVDKCLLAAGDRDNFSKIFYITCTSFLYF